MKFFLREKGQGLVEYALLIVLIAMVVLGILTLLGPQISGAYGRIISALGGGVITNVRVNGVDPGGTGYVVKLTVSVSEATSVTASSGSSSNPVSCSPPSCEVWISGVPSAHGSFTVTAAKGGSFSGSY